MSYDAKLGVIREVKSEVLMTITAAAGGFTTTDVITATGKRREYAFGVVESNPIRMRMAGTPTGTVGVPVTVGQTIEIVGVNNILNAQFIRDTTATGSATIYWQLGE